MNDLEALDDDVYQNLLKLVDIEDVEMLCLDFTVTENAMGAAHQIDLMEGGEDITVTNDNLEEYLR